MNQINLRQNEDNILRLQAAARWNLNRADNIDLLYWIASLLLPLLKVIWKQNTLIDLIFIIWFCLTFYLDYKIGEYTQSGAEYKNFFDKYVYGWINEIPGNVCNSSKEIQAHHSNWFVVQMTHTGNETPRGVKDWYEFSSPKFTIDIAIRKSMTENIKYDYHINHILRTIIWFPMISFLIFAYFRKLLFSELLVTFFITFATLTKKIITTLVNIKRSNEINKEIGKTLEKNPDTTELQYAQDLLYKKRLIPGIGNRCIYSSSKNKITNDLQKFLDEDYQ